LTGLRRGGLCGLRWADVDLATRKITVRRSRVSVRGKVLEQATTKTRAGLRTVPLSDAAVGALLSWQLKQAAEAGAAQEACGLKGMCSSWRTADRSTRATSSACFRASAVRVNRFRR
jgi:integrase